MTRIAPVSIHTRPPRKMKKHLLDFVSFRWMISPVLLQIMFWPAAAASIYYSTWLILDSNAIGWIRTGPDLLRTPPSD